MASYTSEEYNFGGYKKYRAVLELTTSSSAGNKTTTVKWVAKVQMQYGSDYGVGIKVSGAGSSGPKTGYLSSSPGSSWTTVAQTSGSKNFNGAESKQEKTFTATAYGTIVNGMGSAGGSISAKGKATIPALKTYTITYNSNGGSGAPGKQTKYYGKPRTLQKLTPTRSGYTFSHWDTKKDGSGTNYRPGGSYSSNANITLYAQWTPKKYTVTYNKNTDETVSNMPGKQEKTHGISLQLSTRIPIRTGYTFLGWAVSSDGAVRYKVGGSYTTNSDITLRAKWQKLEYTVNFIINASDIDKITGQVPNSQTAIVNENIEMPSLTTTSSYVLKWWQSGNNKIAPGAQFTSNKATTLEFTAIFEESSTSTPIQIYNFDVKRYRTSDSTIEADGGWIYKYSFNWECGKDNTKQPITPTTITAQTDNSEVQILVSSSNSTSGVYNSNYITDYGASKQLKISGSSSSDTTNEFSSEEIFSIEPSTEDIEQITLDNIVLERTGSNRKKVSISFDWEPYYDGNETHTNYNFIFSYKIGEGEYENLGTVSKVFTPNSTPSPVIYETSNDVIDIDQNATFRVTITSFITIDNNPYSKSHDPIELGTIYKVSSVIHINATGTGITLFGNSEDSLNSFRVLKSTEISGGLTISESLTMNNSMVNDSAIRINDSKGNSYSALHTNSSDNLQVGYGFYNNKIGGTQIYGYNHINLRTNGNVRAYSDLTVDGILNANNIKRHGVNYIAYKTFTFTNMSFSSGTIGTRGNQYTKNIKFSGYTPIGCSIASVSSSGSYIPVCFLQNSTTLYLNLYRCTTSSVSGQDVSVHVIYRAN